MGILKGALGMQAARSIIGRLSQSSGRTTRGTTTAGTRRRGTMAGRSSRGGGLAGLARSFLGSRGR